MEGRGYMETELHTHFCCVPKIALKMVYIHMFKTPKAVIHVAATWAGG